MFFYIKNCNLLISNASIMDVQATGEAFSPHKRTSSTSKLEISSHFPIFCGPNPDPHPLVKGTDPRVRIRIRIHNKMSQIRNTDTSIRQLSVPGKKSLGFIRMDERSLLHECVQHSLHPAGCLGHLHQVGVGLHRPQLGTDTLP
jgi:hypothetical protein